MAHREGLRVSYDRPQPPSLNIQGRSLPKIIGQVRAVRRLWAEEEDRLDKEELEAFERLERIEQQLEADLEAREKAATETERNELGEGRRGAPACTPFGIHAAMSEAGVKKRPTHSGCLAGTSRTSPADC